MTGIVALDTAVWDYSTSAPAIRGALQSLGLNQLEKVEGSPHQLKKLKELFAQSGDGATGSPGGSVFNILWTIQGIRQGFGAARLGAKLITCAGDDGHGDLIRAAARQSHIAIIPETGFPGAVTPVSYITNHPPGHGNRRTIVKATGTIAAFLKSAAIPPEAFTNSDILLLAGQMIQKIGKTLPDQLLHQRWAQNKELYLTLPTDKQSGAHHADYFQGLIPSVNALLSNGRELRAVYRAPDRAQAFAKVQQAFRQDVLRREGRAPSRPQVAFITCGEAGAAVITVEKIITIPSQCAEPTFELGAGDSASGAFLAAMLLGYPHEIAGQLAMKVAAANLAQPEAQTALPVLAELGAQLRYTEPCRQPGLRCETAAARPQPTA